MTRCKPGGHMINQLFTAEIWLVLMKTNQLRLDQSLPEQTANRKLTSCQKGEISERNNSQTHTHTHTNRGTHTASNVYMHTHTSLNVYICRHTHTHSCISLCISLVRHDFLTWGMSPHKHTHIYIKYNNTTHCYGFVQCQLYKEGSKSIYNYISHDPYYCQQNSLDHRPRLHQLWFGNLLVGLRNFSSAT